MSPSLLSGAARLAGTSLLRLQSDERLAEMAQAGHDPAFGALVDRYRADLLRYCERLVGQSRAEDVLQQALLNAHLAMSSLTENSNVRAWLYRIAHNVAVNVLRAVPAVTTLDDRAAAPDAIHEDLEVRERLRAALDAISRLPQPQRDALTLRAIEGRSHDEIAAALGVTPGAARQQIHRARATVRAAVSAITPYGLLVRFAMAGGGAPLPTSELAAGAGAGATVAKVAAGLLAAGALAGGATSLPAPGLLHHHRHHPATARAAGTGSGPEEASATTPQGPSGATTVDDHGSRSGRSDEGRGRGGSGRRGDDHGSSFSVSDDRRGSDDVSEHFGSGESHSGSSGDGFDDHSGSGDSGSSGSSGSGSSGTGDDHSGSGDSGSSGSGSGSGDSGSGTSGSGDSGSGTSGSGDGSSGSGSGSDDGSVSTFDLSGSGESGSGSDGSGSDGGSSGSGGSRSTLTVPTSGSGDDGGGGSGSSGPG